MIDRTAEPPSARVTSRPPVRIGSQRALAAVGKCLIGVNAHVAAETLLRGAFKKMLRHSHPRPKIFWGHISTQAQNPLGQAIHGLPPKLACCALAADPAGCRAAGSCSESWCSSCSAEPGALNRWPACAPCTCRVIFAGCRTAARGPRFHLRRRCCCQWRCTDDCAAGSCQCHRTPPSRRHRRLEGHDGRRGGNGAG